MVRSRPAQIFLTFALMGGVMLSGQSPADRESTPSIDRDQQLERITTAVPWPRGLAFVDGKLVVLARGRHRRAGGCDPAIEDFAGHLFQVDPEISELVIPNQPAGPKVRSNARIFAKVDGRPFNPWDREKQPIQDAQMDRPYCTIVFAPASRNLFICGYSGVDLPGATFRKNATDSIHRFDLRVSSWFPVEMHASSAVPVAELTRVVPNQYYPHHDPEVNPAPHGWLNGPNGAAVAGNWLYVVGKDNHTLAQYDLSEIQENARAPVPSSRKVLGKSVLVRHGAEKRQTDLLGPSAVAVHGGHLYVGYRTSSVIVRLPLDKTGDLAPAPVAEMIAEFQPLDSKTRKSANLIDMKFNRQGELFVACASKGLVWNIGRPHPDHVYDGNDARPGRPTTNRPHVDLRALTFNPRARVGNIAFDDQDRLYICSGNYDSGTNLAGVIYRVR